MMSAADHLNQQQFFHGSVYGGPTGTPGPSGVHVGTYEAANQALNNRIGKRADGKDWDGSSEYGKTPIMGRGRRPGPPDTPENLDSLSRWVSPEPATLSSKPAVFPVSITGPMTNTPSTPRGDSASNERMAGHINHGRAKQGYYYENQYEDKGSISAVVPSWDHLKDMRS